MDPPRPEPGPEPVAARLRAARAELVVRLERLAADMASLVAASVDSNADDEHDPEGQTIAYERSQLAALTEQVRHDLAEVDAALERVRLGTYGVCEVCHQPVAPARLEARPTARTCVEHAPPPRR